MFKTNFPSMSVELEIHRGKAYKSTLKPEENVWNTCNKNSQLMCLRARIKDSNGEKKCEMYSV